MNYDPEKLRINGQALTVLENRLLLALMAKPLVSAAALNEITGMGWSRNELYVYIWRLRRKGVAITNRRGIGYELQR